MTTFALPAARPKWPITSHSSGGISARGSSLATRAIIRHHGVARRMRAPRLRFVAKPVARGLLLNRANAIVRGDLRLPWWSRTLVNSGDRLREANPFYVGLDPGTDQQRRWHLLATRPPRLPQSGNSDNWPEFFHLSDLECDGRTDIGLVNHGSGNTALLYLLGPNGTFQPGAAYVDPLAVSHRRLAATAPRAEAPPWSCWPPQKGIRSHSTLPVLGIG